MEAVKKNIWHKGRLGLRMMPECRLHPKR